MWYFNQLYGVWVQDGSAVLEGNFYIGEVDHFSFWNCDAPFDLINLSGTLVTANGTPIVNNLIRITKNSNNASRCGWTDNSGYFSGKVPANEDLTIKIMHGNNTCSLFTILEGNYTTDTDLGTIVIDEPQIVNLSGNILDCDLNPTARALLEVTIGQKTNTFYFEDDNQIFAMIVNCNQEEFILAKVIDLENLQESNVITVPIEDNIADIGAIEACGNVIDEFIILNIDGVETTMFEVGADMTDTIYIEGFRQGPASNYFNMTFNEILSEGTFTGNIINSLNIISDSGVGDVYLWCQNECGVSNLEITSFGDVGEPIIGSFEGTGIFLDSLEQEVTLSFSGQFKIDRDE